MSLRAFCVSLVFLALASPARAQKTPPDLRWMKQRINALSSNAMHGRGYVQKGSDRAAAYLVRQLREIGVQPFLPDSSYTQAYTFPVNTFPGQMRLKLGKKEPKPGVDFLVDAASAPYSGTGLRVTTTDLLRTGTDWSTADATNPPRLSGGPVFLLKNADSVQKILRARRTDLTDLLPKGCYILPVQGKMTWTVSTTAAQATVLYVQDSALPRRIRKADVAVDAKLVPASRQQNVVGIIPGTAAPDSFIVLSAHYDHLGMMGRSATFSGASDNASGTAAVLTLARHFVQHPPRYSVIVVFFAGEEAGLIGSKYFVDHPPVPLGNIRFGLNLDIMGDATDGVTVVNATEFGEEFSALERINTARSYLPQIRQRGKAAISDHHFFTEAGVRCFFLYSNGGAGYYHDVFDKPQALTLKNIPGVLELLKEFLGAL